MHVEETTKSTTHHKMCFREKYLQRMRKGIVTLGSSIA